MTYKNIKTIDNTEYKTGVRQHNQTYNSDGFAGGIVNSQGIVLKTPTSEVMDVATLNSDYIGMGGSCFDGRYMYFHNIQDNNNYYLLRYDTTKAFTTGNVEAMNLTTVNANAKGYSGFVFDGRYVYGVPYGGSGTKHGLFLRYDTHASFTSAGSYAIFDLTAKSSSAKGYQKATFDGRYIYITPFYNGSNYHGLVIRYDTTISFSSSGSYEIFNLASINAAYAGFIDSAIVGDYIYYIPYQNDSGRHGNLIRYKIGETFDSSGSYEIFNLASISSEYINFHGNCFDGRYLYLATYVNSSGGANDRIVRYDTTMDLDNTDAYKVFQTTGLSPDGTGYRSMLYDGRYVYIGPYYDDTADSYIHDMPVYDTWNDFEDSDSWYLFDRTDVDSDLYSVSSINFDGQYLYIFPFTNASVYIGKISRHKIKIYKVKEGF